MRIPGWLFILGLLTLMGGTGICAAATFVLARQAAIDLPGSYDGPDLRALVAAVPSPSPIAPTLTPSVDETTDVEPVPVAEDAPQPTPDPVAQFGWTDPRAVRVLLLGIDQRSGFSEEDSRYFHTDTMIVVNFDPVRHQVALLSIPRDLWVDIPDGGPPDRINPANVRGDSGGYPGGGPALAMQTVRSNLGIPVDKYVLVNFDVFTALVGLLAPNGVEVCVPEAIYDPKYPDSGYGTLEVRFDPGCQRLDPERLLQYARTRATQGSDFDRARRQQQVLKAVQTELVSVGGFANLVAQAPALWAELSGSYRTNLTLDDILNLAAEIPRIGADDIRSGVIDNLYVEFARTPDGRDILIPDYVRIRQLIQQVFSGGETAAPDQLQAAANSENATIRVFNNSEVVGLAGGVRDWLTARGVRIEGVGNTPTPNNRPTVIRDYGGTHSATARYLASLLGLPPDRIEPGADGLMARGVAVIAGPDLQNLMDGG